MSVLGKLKEFLFGPTVTTDKHPLDGPTKKAILEPAPVVVPEPAPAPVPVPEPVAPPPVVEVKVEAPVPAPAPVQEKNFVITPTEWPFPSGEKPSATYTVPSTSTAEVKVTPTKKPRKPRAPKAPAAVPPVPVITTAPKAKGKKK
jgi:hypothetical protein